MAASYAYLAAFGSWGTSKLD